MRCFVSVVFLLCYSLPFTNEIKNSEHLKQQRQQQHNCILIKFLFPLRLCTPFCAVARSTILNSFIHSVSHYHWATQIFRIFLYTIDWRFGMQVMQRLHWSHWNSVVFFFAPLIRVCRVYWITGVIKIDSLAAVVPISPWCALSYYLSNN